MFPFWAHRPQPRHEPTMRNLANICPFPGLQLLGTLEVSFEPGVLAYLKHANRHRSIQALSASGNCSCTGSWQMGGFRLPAHPTPPKSINFLSLKDRRHRVGFRRVSKAGGLPSSASSRPWSCHCFCSFDLGTARHAGLGSLRSEDVKSSVDDYHRA